MTPSGSLATQAQWTKHSLCPPCTRQNGTARTPGLPSSLQISMTKRGEEGVLSPVLKVFSPGAAQDVARLKTAVPFIWSEDPVLPAWDTFIGEVHQCVTLNYTFAITDPQDERPHTEEDKATMAADLHFHVAAGAARGSFECLSMLVTQLEEQGEVPSEAFLEQYDRELARRLREPIPEPIPELITEKPQWLRELDEEQEREMKKLASQRAELYGSLTHSAVQNALQEKFQLSTKQANEFICWMMANPPDAQPVKTTCFQQATDYLDNNPDKKETLCLGALAVLACAIILCQFA